VVNSALKTKNSRETADFGQAQRAIATIRQKQIRLGHAEIEQLAQRYKDGATV